MDGSLSLWVVRRWGLAADRLMSNLCWSPTLVQTLLVPPLGKSGLELSPRTLDTCLLAPLASLPLEAGFFFFPHNGLQAVPPSSLHPILTWSLFSCGAWVPKIYLIVWDPEKMSFSLPNIESMIWSLSYQFGVLPKTHNNQWIPVHLLLFSIFH